MVNQCEFYHLFLISVYFSVGFTYIFLEQEHTSFVSVHHQVAFVLYLLVPVLYLFIYYAWIHWSCDDIDTSILGYILYINHGEWLHMNHSQSISVQPIPEPIQRRADSITIERSRSYSYDVTLLEAMDTCVICLDDFSNDDVVIDTCSGHTFHSECLKKHFETSYEQKVTMRPNMSMERFVFHCPLCKRELEL